MVGWIGKGYCQEYWRKCVFFGLPQTYPLVIKMLIILKYQRDCIPIVNE